MKRKFMIMRAWLRSGNLSLKQVRRAVFELEEIKAKKSKLPAAKRKMLQDWAHLRGVKV